MNKRIFAVIMVIAMLLSLTACGHEHEWTQANCVTPKTCASCEETEGEALGHTWMDASCEVPKTCSACGETEGEALGHAWIDANYQQPKTCDLCGETEGDVLVAGYVEHGMDARLLDKAGTYDLTVPCYDDESKLTTGVLTVDSYKTFASDDTHEAMDGYEWKILVLKIHFSDENATSYGIGGIRYMSDDYYHTGEAAEINPEEENVFEFEWNGVKYTECFSEHVFKPTSWLQDEDGNYYLDVYITFTYRVPVGYDGVVVGVSDGRMEWPVGTCLYEVIDDTARLFRMD